MYYQNFSTSRLTCDELTGNRDVIALSFHLYQADRSGICLQILALYFIYKSTPNTKKIVPIILLGEVLISLVIVSITETQCLRYK